MPRSDPQWESRWPGRQTRGISDAMHKECQGTQGNHGMELLQFWEALWLLYLVLKVFGNLENLGLLEDCGVRYGVFHQFQVRR